MADLIDIILNDSEIIKCINDREDIYLESELGFSQIEESPESVIKNLRLASVLLNHIFSDSIAEKKYIQTAYTLLKSYDIKSNDFKKTFNSVFGIQKLDDELLYYFFLSSLALLSDKTIKIRLDLREFDVKDYSRNDWEERVLNNLFQAFILLVRKDKGYTDIKTGLEIISKLKSEQKEFEEKYLSKLNNEIEVIEQAQYLLGLYHLTKPITETSEFLIEGYNYKNRLDSEIRIHTSVAREIFKALPRFSSIINILESNLLTIERNSIWYSTNSIQIKKLKEFCVKKNQIENGIIELLPSQREALNKNLLDIASNVTVVQMPTSAGKTLLAEFNIIVTKALNNESKVIYIVPSRALVNQIYNDLKTDFEGLDFAIEKTSGAIEVDPSENEILSDKIDILVSTPEKIDLLIRRKHKSVEDVSLFIIDEAHSIQNGSRGARLELLLSILKRERPESKFMFLSPFLKNSGELLANWIGGNKIKVPIQIDWKPAEKLLIGIKQKNKFKQISFTHLPSVFDPEVIERELPIMNNPYDLTGTDKQNLMEFSAKHFTQDNKSILFLCKGAGTTDTQAQYIASKLTENNVSESISLVKKYIEDEVGRPTILSDVLSKRIAVHHAGLSDETKLLIEHLIRQKEIKYIFSTSTLAEGVNFPVSAVYFDSYQKGQGGELSSSDFWNIAGRAGRTLVDNYGKLIFPFNSTENANKAKEIITKSTTDIVSVLLEFLNEADDILYIIANSERSAINVLSEKYHNSLAPLIQYLIHLLNSTNESSVLQIEDLFKDSLGYFQITDNDKRKKFIEVCKAIFVHLQNKYKKGVLVYADKTGFSVPSVLAIMAENSSNPKISSPESWEPSNLFNFNNDYLTEKIRVIAQLRETKLGTENRSAQFSPESVANVLIGWVKGENLFNISSYHQTFANIASESDRINKFIKYINDSRFKASWGLSALEGIVNGSEFDIKENSFVPSLVYFGVDNKDALLMRMAGIPRRLAFTLTPIIDQSKPTSLKEIRSTIKSLTNQDWDNLAPKNSKLSGQEWKRISEILVH